MQNDLTQNSRSRAPWLTKRNVFLVLVIVVIGFVATRFFQTSRTRNAVDVLVGQNAYISMQGWHRAPGILNNVGVDPGPKAVTFLNAYSMLPGASVAGVFLGSRTHPPVRDASLCIAAISHLDEIRSLGLYDPKFGNHHLEALHAPKLHSLNLTGSGVTGAGLRHLERFPYLQSLDLTGLNIRDADLAHFRSLPRVYGSICLKNLQLNKTQIGDDGVVHLLSLDRSLQIDLSDTNLSDKGLLLLTQIKKLTKLNVSNTQVTAEGVRQFQERLRWCQITSNAADDVEESPTIQPAESH